MAATLTVTGPTLTLGASTVAAGGVLTATLSNGPGTVSEWVGLYCPSTSVDQAYLQWKYLNNTQTLPGSGVTSATVTFVAPATVGVACNVRWFGGGGKLATSSAVTVANPVPTVTALTPASIAAGSAAFALTVTGTGFVSGAVVQVDGSARVTTVSSSTSVTAALLATDVAATGTHTITVVNPTPGGGSSAGATLTVIPPPVAPTGVFTNPIHCIHANGYN